MSAAPFAGSGRGSGSDHRRALDTNREPLWWVKNRPVVTDVTITAIVDGVTRTVDETLSLQPADGTWPGPGDAPWRYRTSPTTRKPHLSFRHGRRIEPVPFRTDAQRAILHILHERGDLWVHETMTINGHLDGAPTVSVPSYMLYRARQWQMIGMRQPGPDPDLHFDFLAYEAAQLLGIPYWEYAREHTGFCA